MAHILDGVFIILGGLGGLRTGGEDCAQRHPFGILFGSFRVWGLGFRGLGFRG